MQTQPLMLNMFIAREKTKRQNPCIHSVKLQPCHLQWNKCMVALCFRKFIPTLALISVWDHYFFKKYTLPTFTEINGACNNHIIKNNGASQSQEPPNVGFPQMPHLTPFLGGAAPPNQMNHKLAAHQSFDWFPTHHQLNWLERQNFVRSKVCNLFGEDSSCTHTLNIPKTTFLPLCVWNFGLENNICHNDTRDQNGRKRKKMKKRVKIIGSVTTPIKSTKTNQNCFIPRRQTSTTARGSNYTTNKCNICVYKINSAKQRAKLSALYFVPKRASTWMSHAWCSCCSNVTHGIRTLLDLCCVIHATLGHE